MTEERLETTVDLGNLAMGVLVGFVPVIVVLILFAVLVVHVGSRPRTTLTQLSMLVIGGGILVTVLTLGWVMITCLPEGDSYIDRRYPVVKFEEEGER